MTAPTHGALARLVSPSSHVLAKHCLIGVRMRRQRDRRRRASLQHPARLPQLMRRTMPAAMKIGDGDKKEAPDRPFLFDVIAATSPDAGALRIARPPSLR